jgi:hypothetical protein
LYVERGFLSAKIFDNKGETMEEKVWEEARRILEALGYRVQQLGGSARTPYPFNLLAVRSNEHVLIDVKYAEGDQVTTGFPGQWIRQAYEELYKKGVPAGWKVRVLLITRHDERLSYLFLEPRFEKPWFKLDG